MRENRRKTNRTHKNGPTLEEFEALKKINELMKEYMPVLNKEREELPKEIKELEHEMLNKITNSDIKEILNAFVNKEYSPEVMEQHLRNILSNLSDEEKHVFVLLFSNMVEKMEITKMNELLKALIEDDDINRMFSTGNLFSDTVMSRFKEANS